MFKRKSKQIKELTKIQKRVNHLPTPELYAWSDQILYAIGRNLSIWQKTQIKDALDEAHMGAEALHAILDTIKERAI